MQNLKFRQGSTLFIGLFIVASVITLIFINKDLILHREQTGLNYQKEYIKSKYELQKHLQIDHNQLCQQKQQQIISIKVNKIEYSFRCGFYELFLNKQITVKQIDFHNMLDLKNSKIEDFIKQENLNRIIDLKNYKGQIYYVKSIAELNNICTSVDTPALVVATAPLGEKISILGVINNDLLTRNFYGVIISPFAVNIKTKANTNMPVKHNCQPTIGEPAFYGVLITSNPKQKAIKQHFYLNYGKNCVNNAGFCAINNLRNQSQHWFYLEHSQTIYKNDDN